MEITAQYMEFLKANYSTVAGRLETLLGENPTGNTPEEIEKSKAAIDEEIKSLAEDSERVNKYRIWEKVPQILRDRYGGCVPPEVMEAADRDEIYVLREMEYHPEKRNVDEVRAEVEEKYRFIIMPDDIINASFMAKSVFAGAIVAGYAVDSSAELARARMASDELSAKLLSSTLTDAERAEIHQKFLQLHQHIHDVIKKDWGGDHAKGVKPHQPEKLLIHLLGKHNAGKIDKNELVAIMADLQPHLKDRQSHLLEYIQRDNIQAKIGHFKDSTRDLLAHYALNVLPDKDRSRIMEVMEKGFLRKKAAKDLSGEQQAIAVAKNISANRDNVLPQQHNLSVQEKRAAMPSALNQGNERTA